MKKAIITGLLLLAFLQTNGYCQKNRNLVQVKPDSVAVDSIKYSLIVLDQGFDSWLAAKPPMNFYSKEYYEVKNRLYVTEWNYRHQNQGIFGDLYESKIDYEPFIEYGLELNYRLYYYFRFFEETNHVKLLNQSH